MQSKPAPKKHQADRQIVSQSHSMLLPILCKASVGPLMPALERHDVVTLSVVE